VSPPRRRLLLIAYKFPPYAGVGGFRWAKLSKYLARLGHEVHVVTVPWPEHGPNTLAADAAEPGVIVHPIRSGSPHRLRHMPLSGRWAIAARYFALRALDRVLFYDDEAQRWGRHLIGACERLIDEHDIGVVVATGHPFQANRWAAELKRRQPGLRLVQDFRDPWADNPFRALPPRLAARVRAWQEDAVAAADAVVSVTPSLLDLYLRGATEPRSLVIPNGADPATVPDVHANGNGDPGRIRLTHIGNVSNGRGRPLRALLDAVRQIDGPPTIEVVLVGAMLDAIGRANADLVGRGSLRIQAPVSQDEALRRVAASDYALQLNAREFPYLVSTKIYEYALLRVPALSLNYGGEVDTLVRDHGFGHSVDLSRRPDLPELLRSLPERAAADRGGGLAFDVQPFTYPVLAREYSALIESL
jgi:glycosyltransferase involved in cell wall biosynthesis